MTTETVYLTRSWVDRIKYDSHERRDDALAVAIARGCIECGATASRLFLDPPLSPEILTQPTVYVTGACDEHAALLMDRINTARRDLRATLDPCQPNAAG